jgi:hypothetical protein
MGLNAATAAIDGATLLTEAYCESEPTWTGVTNAALGGVYEGLVTIATPAGAV